MNEGEEIVYKEEERRIRRDETMKKIKKNRRKARKRFSRGANGR